MIRAFTILVDEKAMEIDKELNYEKIALLHKDLKE